MLSPSPQQHIFLAAQPVDMRGGFDRLAAHVRNAGLDPYAGHLYVFLSRRRTHLKVLTWDGSGLVVLYKRLSKGVFTRPDLPADGRAARLDPAALAHLLQGLQVRGVRRSKSTPLPRPAIDHDPGP
jgi:transposase